MSGRSVWGSKSWPAATKPPVGRAATPRMVPDAASPNRGTDCQVTPSSETQISAWWSSPVGVPPPTAI